LKAAIKKLGNYYKQAFTQERQILRAFSHVSHS